MCVTLQICILLFLIFWTIPLWNWKLHIQVTKHQCFYSVHFFIIVNVFALPCSAIKFFITHLHFLLGKKYEDSDVLGELYFVKVFRLHWNLQYASCLQTECAKFSSVFRFLCVVSSKIVTKCLCVPRDKFVLYFRKEFVAFDHTILIVVSF